MCGRFPLPATQTYTYAVLPVKGEASTPKLDAGWVARKQHFHLCRAVAPQRSLLCPYLATVFARCSTEPRLARHDSIRCRTWTHLRLLVSSKLHAARWVTPSVCCCCWLGRVYGVRRHSVTVGSTSPLALMNSAESANVHSWEVRRGACAGLLRSGFLLPWGGLHRAGCRVGQARARRQGIGKPRDRPWLLPGATH